MSSILLAELLHAALAGYALVGIEQVFHKDLVFRAWGFLTFRHDCRKIRNMCRPIDVQSHAGSSNTLTTPAPSASHYTAYLFTYLYTYLLIHFTSNVRL